MLRQAIEEPARRVGLGFEPGVVDKILNDVAYQPGALPLLEHALLELRKRWFVLQDGEEVVRLGIYQLNFE